MQRPPIHSLHRDALAAILQSWGEPAWRTGQILDWLYRKRVDAFSSMSNLPAALRQRLNDAFEISLPEMVRRQGSVDATQKFLWRLPDGSLIESVLMPATPALYGEGADRQTLCVSTQVGCAYGCRFCASGLEGWKRNLGPDEIVGQVLAVERAASPLPASGEKVVPRSATANGVRVVDNLVIMGMGEPLANYDNLLVALRILNAPWGAGIGARKITVSTSGLAPQICRLADEPEQFRLAISLHGATDAIRGRIMPINRKYPLDELTAACEYYTRRKGRMITFEYILLAEVNDDPRHVPPLAAMARRLGAKVNLIPYNVVPELPWSRPTDAACRAVLTTLERAGVPATLRMEKGHDIDAACGQLRLQVERRELAGAKSGV
jgi:23S rRNA (adenine2503-C2)-methyltransferase